MMDPQLEDSPVSLLEGFQFNPKASIHNTFVNQLPVSTEIGMKEVRVDIQPFIPSESVRDPNGECRYFKLIPVIAAINFKTHAWHIEKTEPTLPLACNDKKVKAITVRKALGKHDGCIIIVALGIQFYLPPVGGEYLAVAAGGHDALGIIRVFKL
jgi:hypothetical protein